jgi:hypothetical protein
MRITLSIDEQTKKTFNQLSDALIKKGYFRSKAEFFSCLIEWSNRDKDKIDWKDVRFFNIQ